MTTFRNLTLTSILTMTVLVGATPAAAGGKADGCRQGRFVVTEGATALGGDECTLSAPYTEATLVADENDWLTFDLTTSPVGMSGFAGSAGGLVDLTVACPDGDPVVSQTEAGGTWFVAPQDGGYTVASTTFAGSYSDGATLGTTVEWSFTKVE